MSKYFKIETNKPAVSYKCGEEMVFTITAKENCRDIECKYIKWQITTDDGKAYDGYGSIGFGKPLVLKTSLSKPGFVRVTCTPLTDENMNIPGFDVLEAGAGAEIEKLSYCDTLPDDFTEYWAAIEKMVAEFDCQPIYFKEITETAKKGFKVYEVHVSTPVGRPATGFITVPDKEGTFPMVVEFRGYSLVGATPMYRDGAIKGCFSAHGIEALNQVESYMKYGGELTDYGFNEKENESNMTTYWRDMMIRNLCAAKYMKTLPQWNKKQFIARGGSQGALQATTVAAHDKDVTFLDILVPWFCNLNAESKGFMAGWRPRFKEGLRYFDTVAQAMFVKCPVNIEARLGDYVCPPSTTVTLYNTFKCQKRLELIQAGTHPYNPPEREIFVRLSDGEKPITEVKKGKYRHFKGNEYEVIDTGFDSENMEEVVIYKALYGDNKIWVRPKHMFLENTWYKGEYVKRFTYIG
ncbi:MAG: DUF1653 domain-containing protein [Ruminococcaceae bacterium]|nr:DUF1653 domain-containing protein [Oscillospiraceae bacterium]